jgi:hypothetical protein
VPDIDTPKMNAFSSLLFSVVQPQAVLGALELVIRERLYGMPQSDQAEKFKPLVLPQQQPHLHDLLTFPLEPVVQPEGTRATDG